MSFKRASSPLFCKLQSAFCCFQQHFRNFIPREFSAVKKEREIFNADKLSIFE